MIGYSVLRRPFVGAARAMSTLSVAVAILDHVDASRRAAFGKCARHPIVVRIHAALPTVAFSPIVIRGTMTWAVTHRLQLAAVGPG
jgi:hypothetical protein